jgi:hypothetical protein
MLSARSMLYFRGEKRGVSISARAVPSSASWSIRESRVKGSIEGVLLLRTGMTICCNVTSIPKVTACCRSSRKWDLGNDVDELLQLFRSANRILAIVSAGLSRPSNLPTFRQDAWFWQCAWDDLESSTAIVKNSSTVLERFRQIALTAHPNMGH